MPAGVSLEYGETFPGGNPGRRSAVEAALAGFRDIRTGSSNVAAVFTRRPGRGAARFPFGRLFPTAHRICNLQSARMVMDSNQKTIKGAQSVYRVLNILEEVILCGDRMITPKELSASLDIPVATVHRLLTVLRQKILWPATRPPRNTTSGGFPASSARAWTSPPLSRPVSAAGGTHIPPLRLFDHPLCPERLRRRVRGASRRLASHTGFFSIKTGDRRPLGMGSATLSILAAMPEDEAEMILTHNEQEIRFVLKTDFSALRGFLAEARRKGYASAQGMLLEGTIGVSHVLRMGNEAVGSIAIDAVRSEQWDKDQPKIIQELQSALS